jgi:hypothetical protein
MRAFVSVVLHAQRSGAVLNVTLSEPYKASVSQELSLAYRKEAHPSQLPLCQKPGGPVSGSQTDLYSETSLFGTFKCRTILSEVSAGVDQLHGVAYEAY